MILDKDIERVLDATSLPDLIGSYSSLVKSGSRLKCCCPLHGEKTPSMMIYPGEGRYHCFGCKASGNAISFMMAKEGMSYPDAIKWLAKRANIDIHDVDQEMTDEDRTLQVKRESMYAAMKLINDFFVENLRSSTEEAVFAFKYATGRWSQEFIERTGIGYAFKSSDSLISFARSHYISEDLLFEMGMVGKGERGYYDFFRERVTIPIRDRYGRVIAFTARAVRNTDTSKYLNNKNTLIYKKDSSIFGLDIAKNNFVHTNRFLVVEGAPDVLKLQMLGATNAVASLGSAWTDRQLTTLKSYCDNICFIPDADPPKQGNLYGTGVLAVIDNGVKAWNLGINVSVKEIPLTKDGEKNDPDSYFKTFVEIQNQKEEDFLVWYCDKLIARAKNPNEQVDVINKVATLLATCNDSVKESMYTTLLSKIVGKESDWKSAISNAKRRMKEQQANKEEDNVNLKILESYGFQEKDNCYISISEKGKVVVWSNFIMRPLFHIKDVVMPLRLYEIKNKFGTKEIVEMKQEDLVSLTKFKQRVEGLGNFVWLAKEEQLTKLKIMLYETTESAVLIKQLGWNRKGFFAFGNGIFDVDSCEWVSSDDLGIVRLSSGNYYLQSASKLYEQDTEFFSFERKFIHQNYSNISLLELSKLIVDVFGDNGKVAICYYIASLFRDIIVSTMKSFPILNIFGPKGSGKSELGHTLMSFFIINNTPVNLSNATKASLSETVAQSANALVHIDEYKNSVDPFKIEFLKGLWDGAGRTRMNMDRDKRTEMTRVDSGIILTGQEMPTADIALFSRVLFLSFANTFFNVEQTAKFENLVRLRQLGFSHITISLLKYRKRFEKNFRSAYDEVAHTLSSFASKHHIETRTINNWMVPLIAYKSLSDVLNLSFSYDNLFSICCDLMVRQNSETSSYNEIAGFWTIVSYLHQDGKIWIDCDYRIEFVSQLKVNGHTYDFGKDKKILFLRFTKIFQLYRMHGKSADINTLPISSLTYYIENSPEYLGKKNSMRFVLIQNGYPVMIEQTSGESKILRKQSSIDQAMCFDYQSLQNLYGLSLEQEICD